MKRYEIYYKGDNIFKDRRSYKSKYYAINIMENLCQGTSSLWKDFELKETTVDEAITLTASQKKIIYNSLCYMLFYNLEDDVVKDIKVVLELIEQPN